MPVAYFLIGSIEISCLADAHFILTSFAAFVRIPFARHAGGLGLGVKFSYAIITRDPEEKR